MGASGDSSHVPTLVQGLGNDDGNVRRMAASALGKLRAAEAVQTLMHVAVHDDLPQVRQYAIKALGIIGDPSALATLQRIAQTDTEPSYNITAAQSAVARLTTL
jgi:HEAT repeat protein